MKNIQFFHVRKYDNQTDYQLIEPGIYKELGAFEPVQFSSISEDDLHFFDDSYRMAIQFEIEDNETFQGQYPMEDILDQFSLHVADFLDEENSQRNRLNCEYVELGGKLSCIQEASRALLGKRAFNERYLDDDGEYYIRLVIE